MGTCIILLASGESIMSKLRIVINILFFHFVKLRTIPKIPNTAKT
ncbi:hypothetical protein [Chryseobacterium sp. Tr-659]|nr:hypothetical protein [Chryseobacterium sp. Tr-659]